MANTETTCCGRETKKRGEGIKIDKQQQKIRDAEVIPSKLLLNLMPRQLRPHLHPATTV